MSLETRRKSQACHPPSTLPAVRPVCGLNDDRAGVFGQCGRRQIRALRMRALMRSISITVTTTIMTIAAVSE